MTKAELGVKRRCLTCSTAFFDLNRAPIVCPKCKDVFHVVELLHSAPRRGAGFPSGARWRSPAQEAVAEEINSRSDDQGEDEDVAPAASDDESPEVDLVDDESPEVDMVEETM